MAQDLFITLIVPCRNEEEIIGACLDSLLGQDYPPEKMEIIVVDGASEDRTQEIVREYSEKDARVRLLINPKKFTPISMNMGLENARGDVIAKTDAHTIYPKDYLPKTADYFTRFQADAVGGVIKTTPSDITLPARAMALVLTSKFGAGNSEFRTGAEKPHYSDTAFGIVYRKEVFKKIGLFNEMLSRSQDIDFNLRLTRAGGKILLAPDVQLEYHPKATFEEFWEHNIKDGIWAILPMKFGSPILKLRHLMPLIFVSSFLGMGLLGIFWGRFLVLLFLCLLGYLGAAFYFASHVAGKEKAPELVPYLVIAFIIRHFGYGLGSLLGVIKLAV